MITDLIEPQSTKEIFRKKKLYLRLLYELNAAIRSNILVNLLVSFVF